LRRIIDLLIKATSRSPLTLFSEWLCRLGFISWTTVNDL